MKVHVVNISLLDCEAVTLAGHNKTWLKADINRYLHTVGGTLDSFESTAHDEFKVIEIDFGMEMPQEVTPGRITFAALRALLG
jgi:hypothetical protein